jgi:hypothetical protein
VTIAVIGEASMECSTPSCRKAILDFPSRVGYSNSLQLRRVFLGITDAAVVLGSRVFQRVANKTGAGTMMQMLSRSIRARVIGPEAHRGYLSQSSLPMEGRFLAK